MDNYIKYVLYIVTVIYIWSCNHLLTEAGEWRAHGTHNYYFSSGAYNWTEAKRRCNDNQESNLASITNDNENKFIKDTIRDREFWIGLTPGNGPCDCRESSKDDCKICRDSWIWTDGTPMTFQKWVNEEPARDEDCARFSAQNNWAGIGCAHQSYRFICKSDLCNFKMCANGGACSAEKGKATCTCTVGFTDSNCTTNIDDCADGPCKNGATCEDRINAYTCHCAHGFNGTNCETNLCNIIQCQNGTCVSSKDGTVCKCYPGYTGNSCETILRYDDDKSNKGLWISLYVGIASAIFSGTVMVVMIYLYIQDGKSRDKIYQENKHLTSEAESESDVEIEL